MHLNLIKAKPRAKVPAGVQKMASAFNRAPSLKQMLADLEDTDVADVLRVADQNQFIQAKVMVVKLSGSSENATNSIIQLLESI